jgi:hypothetical protein
LQKASHPQWVDFLSRPTHFAPILLALSVSLSYIYADRAMPVPDEGALLTAAAKLLHGGVFYRDVDAYAFPGVSYLLAGMMSIFGEHLSVARALAGSFFCTIILGVYACALTLMDRRRAALCGLSLLSLKFFAFPIFTMFFYADASLAAAILALALFLRHSFGGPSARLFGVGLLTGLSIVTKQSTGIYVAAVFAIILLSPALVHGPKRRFSRTRELLTYGSGVSLVVGIMAAYFSSHGLFVDMIRGGLVRPFTGYLPTGGVSFLPPLEWWNFGELKSQWPIYFPQRYVELVIGWTQPGDVMRNVYLGVGESISRIVYCTVPIVYGACAWVWIREFRLPASDDDRGNSDEDAEHKDEQTLARSRFFSTSGISLAITLSAFPRADFTHIMTIYPAVVLVLFALSRPVPLGRGRAQLAGLAQAGHEHRIRFEAAFVAFLLIATSFLSLRYDATLTHRMSIERADLWVKPRDAWLERLVEFVQIQIPEGESFFVYGHEAHWYFLSNRYTPRAFSQLYPGMTGDPAGSELAMMIRNTRPRVVAQGIVRWPGTPVIPAYTGELEKALQELYRSEPLALTAPPKAGILRVMTLRE